MLIQGNFNVERIIFYNRESKWGVLGCTPKKSTVELNVLLNSFGSITVSGNFEGVYEGCEIELTGEVIVNPKYGKQVQIKSIKVLQDSKGKEGIINFLSKSVIRGISVQNAKKIYNEFKEDSISIVLNNPEKLLSIKGIGDKTYEKIKESVEYYKSIEKLIVFGTDLGLSYSLICKLHDELGENAVEVIKEDPFKILDLSQTITFKQVDEIFLKLGGLPEDENRLERAFLYTLKNIVVIEGSTGTSVNNLRKKFNYTLELSENSNAFNNTLKALKDLNKVSTNDLGNIIYYKEYLEIEKSIAEKVNSLITYGINGLEIDKNIVEEEIRNFPFTLNKQQVESIYKSIQNNISVLTGAAGCVDGATEYYNGTEWKEIQNYTKGERVLQYNIDGTANLVLPSNYIKTKATNLNYIENKKNNMYQVISDNHRFIYKRKGKVHVVPFETVKEQIKNGLMNDCYLINTFKYSYSGESNSNLTSYNTEQVQLFVALSIMGKRGIDNTIYRVKSNSKRKINKLKELLSLNKFEVEEKHFLNGFTDISIKTNRNYKEFPKQFYNLEEPLRKVFCEAIFFWGNGTTYETNIESNADIAQFLICQEESCPKMYTKMNKGELYYVVEKPKKQKMHLENVTVENFLEDTQYCFTVPSGMLVLRRSKSIFVTGNSGKSSITKALYNIYKRCKFNVVLLSPTAKACRRLEECTGGKAQTIHKFLGIKIDGDSYDTTPYNENTVIIIDESSMMDILLFNKLLSKATPTTRIILIGDNNQLPSVMAGNVLGDLIDSKKVTTSILTDIMRQKENSNIINYCTMINKGEVFEPCIKKDFHYEEFEHNDELQEFLRMKYLEEVKKYGLSEVQVITPYKKGEVGMNNLNKILQEAQNSEGMEMIEPYRIGDRVRHTQNNYAKEVYNGETGIIIGTEDDEIVVDYGYKKIKYNSMDIDELSLAYCSTVHASQGSEYKVCFVILDNTAVNDFLFIRRLLYTAVSRGREKVYILTNPYLVDKCIENNVYKPRVTKLKEFLNRKDI